MIFAKSSMETVGGPAMVARSMFDRAAAEILAAARLLDIEHRAAVQKSIVARCGKIDRASSIEQQRDFSLLLDRYFGPKSIEQQREFPLLLDRF